MSTHSGRSYYHPRNVINATDIKKIIVQRCQERNDTSDIQSWMINHFYRFVIGNFNPPAPALIQVHSLEAAMEKLSISVFEHNEQKKVPEWLEKAFKLNTALYWLDCEHPLFFELETKFIEFLYSRQANPLGQKRLKINAFQALALYEHEHRLFQIKQLNGVVPHHPDAVKTLFKTDIGEFVEFNPTSQFFRDELMFESQHMRHCIGQFQDKQSKTGGYAEYYAQACENQQMKIFSFRSDNHAPKMTISAKIDAEHRLIIQEVKGKQNQPPVEKYHGLLIDFLNSLPCSQSYPIDLCKLGLVFCQNKWQKINDIVSSELKAQITWQSPDLALSMKDRPRMVDWILAARAPELLHRLEESEYINQHIQYQAK